MPVWISKELTLAVHQRQLAEHGGLEGVRDEGALDSALARPQHLVAYSASEPDITSLAATYAFGIARNHPFSDGNKRTAYVVCRVFFILNGWDFTANREERYATFLALAAGELSEKELTAWLRENVQPKAPGDAGR